VGPSAEISDQFLAFSVQPLACQVFRADGTGEMAIETGGERVTDLLNRMDDASAAEIFLLIPPTQEFDARRRLHRPGQDVRMVIGPYEVLGQVHVPPGTLPTAYLGRVNPRFVPITHATIRLVDGDGAKVSAEVVLANLRLASLLREVAPADQEPREGTVSAR
jgi:hypothetical protein